MARKERKKRSARQARQAEREAQQAAQATVQQQSSSSVSSDATSKAKKTKAPVSTKRKGPISRIGGYFATVRSEMNRVVWPNRKEMVNYTIGVVFLLIFFGVAIWLVDTGVVATLVSYTGLKG